MIPIEMKSGKNYQSHSALDNVLKERKYAIQRAYILSNGNLFVDGKKLYLPIYMSMFLKKDELPDMRYSLDLSSLG